MEFLEATSDKFELVLFSNGSSVYTEAVVNKLMQCIMNGTVDPHSEEEEKTKPTRQKYFEHILSREQCSVNEKGHEIKNLNFFTGPGSNRELKDCILIDNSIYCYQLHLTNGLFVPNYVFGDTGDDWLAKLKTYLIERFTIEGEDTADVRTLISKDLRFEEIFNLSTLSQIR